MTRLYNDDLSEYFNNCNSYGCACGCTKDTYTVEEEEILDNMEKKSDVDNVLALRDRLVNLENLVEVISDFLIHSRLNKAKIMAAEVLYFYAKKEIRDIEQELKNV